MGIPSSILNKEIEFNKQLQNWLGEKCGWSLCYRASRDGWNADDFHRHCDHKGPTVVLIKANNCIFGGYTDKNWGGTYGGEIVSLEHCITKFIISMTKSLDADWLRSEQLFY
jgi:hypothetical protein